MRGRHLELFRSRLLLEVLLSVPLTWSAAALATQDADEAATDETLGPDSALGDDPPLTEDEAAEDDLAGAIDDPASSDEEAFSMTDDLKPAALTDPNLVTDGTQPVVVRDGDFSIVPPKGWKVYTEMPGLALFLEAPTEPRQKYQSSIQVASFSGTEFIDDTVVSEYEALLVKRFGQASKAIDGYRVRNSEPIQMTDGRAGMVFYAEFFYAGEPLMQMHVLVSSRGRHYLITYTDVAAHFAAENDPFVAAVWDVVTSTKLGDTPPARNETLYVLLGAAGLMLAFGAGAFGVNLWMSTKRVSEQPGEGVATELSESSEDRFPVSRVPVELSTLDDDDDDLPYTPLNRDESAKRSA